MAQLRRLGGEVMAVDVAGGGLPGQAGATGIGELEARCKATSDHAERAALLARLAEELAARARACTEPDTVAALRGRAEAARRQAGAERVALARAAEGGHRPR